MTSSACTVGGCDEPKAPTTEGTKDEAVDLCKKHRKSFQTYGTPEPSKIDPSIPMYNAPGVPQAHVDRLKAMTWPELVAYCDRVRGETVAGGHATTRRLTADPPGTVAGSLTTGSIRRSASSCWLASTALAAGTSSRCSRSR